jgi:hypothetical protein
VLRVGIGRLLFEGALGALLVQPMPEDARVVSMALAVLGAIVAHLVGGKRRGFFAAHVALAGAALSAHLSVALAAFPMAVALGGAIELAHVDLVDRRRITEHVRSLRVPSSLLIRRLGSAVIVAAIGRASIPVAALAARPTALAPLLVVLGALAMLAAGFGAGPGRPVTRPLDAAIFVALAIVLAVPFAL